jgi:hypothetical protein
MKKELTNYLKSIAVEVPVYAAVVTVYILVVLKFLGKHLYDWFQTDRWLYAGAAVGLIIGQGFVLELATRFLGRGLKKKQRH